MYEWDWVLSVSFELMNLENRPSSIGMNSERRRGNGHDVGLSQNRMLGNRIPSMHDYCIGISFC